MANATAIRGFRADIAGLRAVAVLAVVCYHFGIPGFRGGFIGVDVFFVISGYLMTQILCGAFVRGSFSLVDFYLARARRILPGLLALSAVVLGFGWLRLVPPDLKELASQVAASVLFVSNFDFLRQFGYFDTADHQSWMLHTWSLSVEWQFYLLYPLFLLAVRRFTTRTAVLAHLVGLLALASLALSMIVTPHRPGFAFYMLITRAWELLAGACVFLSLERIAGLERWSAWLGAAGLLLIAAGAILFEPSMYWPDYAACIPVAGAMLVLVARRTTSVVLANPAAQLLGNCSYSIYLWHWPIVVALDNFQVGATPGWKIAGIAASMLAGWLSWRLVETPGRRLLLGWRPGLQLPAFGVAAAAVAIVAGLVIAQDGLPGRSGMRGYAQLAQSVWHNPTFADGWCVANNDGQLGLTFERKYDECTAGDAAASHTVLLWGDSHAGHFAPMLSVLAKDAHLRLKVMSSPECKPLLQSKPAYILGINPDVCRRYKELVPATLADYDFVILAARWEGIIGDGLAPELRDTLSLLKAAGAKVVLLSQIPDFDKDPSRLYIYSKLFGYPLQSVLAPAAGFRKANQQLRLMAGQFSNVVVVDPASILCRPPGTGCDIVLDGKGIYADHDHLNAAGSVAVARRLIASHSNFLASNLFGTVTVPLQMAATQ